MTPSVALETPDISVIETPEMGGIVSGDSVKISGWSISMKEITAVKCTVNDKVTIDCTRQQRDDVAALNPGYPKGQEGYSCDVSAKDLVYGTNTVKVDTYVGEEIISTSTVTFELEYTANIKGDANHDCAVDTKDAVLMKMYLAGSDVEIDKSLSDLNADTVVDTIDAVMIMKYLAGSGDILSNN